MKCLIWGTGFRGRECFSGIQSVEGALEVLAFVDNNAPLWNQEISGIPVLPPSKVNEMAFDRIIVCSKEGMEAICAQLIRELHVPNDKIIRYRIDPLPIQFEANAEDVYLAQLGEFGYEMISWIPYLTYLKSQGIPLKTIGRKGSSVFYENISCQHIEVGDEYVGNSRAGDLERIDKLKKDTGLPVFAPCKERMGCSYLVNGIEWQIRDIHCQYPVEHLKKPEFLIQNILGIKEKKRHYRGIVTVNNKNYFNQFAGLVKNFFMPDELYKIFRFLINKGYFVIYNCSNHLFNETSDTFKRYVLSQDIRLDRESFMDLNDFSDGTEDRWDRMQLECWQNSDFVIQPPGGAAAVVELLGVRKFYLMRKGDYQDDVYLSKLYGGQSDTFYEVRHMLAYMEKEFEAGRL